MKTPVVIVVASLSVAIVLMTSLLIAGGVKQSDAEAPVGRTLMAR